MYPLNTVLNFFDLKRYFKERHKAITTNRPEWVRINCTNHNDHRHHLYINIEEYFFNCFRCNFSGPLFFLFRELLNLDHEEEIVEYLKLLPYYSEFQLRERVEKDEPIASDKPLEYPKYSIPLWMPYSPDENNSEYMKIVNYLENRGFNSSYISKYKLGYCYAGEYNNRLIMPVYYKHQVVSYVMRSLNPKVERKYMNLSQAPINQYLYGFDELHSVSRIILCEGIFDQWKTSQICPSVAMFKKRLSPEQLQKLLTIGPLEVILVLDTDAWIDSLKLGEKLEQYFNVTLMKLESGDPGDSFVETLQTTYDNRKSVSGWLLSF